MSEIYTEIFNCDLCGSDKLEEILNFGTSPLANKLKNSPDEKEIGSPLVVVKCQCGCFQLNAQVNPKVLFSNYNYQSSKGLEQHFKEYAHHTFKLLKSKKDDLIIGIGGNTGLLEIEYQKLGAKVINVEPAKNIAQISKNNGIETVCKFFNKKVVQTIVNKYGKAKLITINNCLAHLKVQPIIEGIKELLSDEGFFIFENAYLLDTVKNNDIGQFYSEHYKYLSIKPLYNFFNLHNLELVKVEYNKIQCGSFRGYVTQAKNSVKFDYSVEEGMEKEKMEQLYNKERYSFMQRDVHYIKNAINNFIINKKTEEKNKKMGIFSVPAKIVLILKFFGIADFFDFAVEDADNKIGKYIPGTKIKIISRNEFYEKFSKDTSLLFCGAYNFAEQIIKNNKEFMGDWLIPLPQFKVLNHMDFN